MLNQQLRDVPSHRGEVRVALRLQRPDRSDLRKPPSAPGDGFLALPYCTGVPLARHVAGFPSLEDLITPDWSAQNALRP
jgi:hypothetical protein